MRNVDEMRKYITDSVEEMDDTSLEQLYWFLRMEEGA